MESVLNIIHNQNPGAENWQPFFDNLKSKTDVILHAAHQADQQHSSTVLMNAVSTLNIQRDGVGAAILLSFQSEELSDHNVRAFVRTATRFFHGVTKEHAMIAHKEGE